MIAVLTMGKRLGRMPSVRGNMGDRLRATGVSRPHKVCVIVPGSSADRDAHAQRSRPHGEVNAGLELYRLSVQARGNRIAGGHVQGARGPFAAGRPGGTARPVESEDAEPAAVERLAKSAPAPPAAG